MTNNDWMVDFTATVNEKADMLIKEAYGQCQTYDQAIHFIKKLSAQSYGSMRNSEDKAAKNLNSAVCDLALSRIYDEMRGLKIADDKS